MKNLTLSSASCKNNPGQCARSAVPPPYLLKHQLWTWFPGLCLFGACRLPLPSLPSCSRFCRGSVSACPKLQPRPGRPSVRQQKQEREVAWKWTAHQGLVRRGVVGLHHKELRSASGSSNSIGTKLLQLVKHTEQIFWLNLWQDLVVKERQWDPRSLPLHHCLENQTHILFSWKDPPPEYPSCWEHTVTRQNPHPSRNFLCWKQVSSSFLVFYK